MLAKKAFKILQSPPPIAACKSKIDAQGNLTIGWRGDVQVAWHLVLEIFEEHKIAQAIALSELPVGAAANPVPLGGTVNPVPVGPAAKLRANAADRKRKRDIAFLEAQA